jgi:hypothetical protein
LGDNEAWCAKVIDKAIGIRTKSNLLELGKFVHPHVACFDRNGYILVAEWVVIGRASKLVKVG